MEGDSEYFSRRAVEERTAASEATHPAAKRAHEELADRYEDLARAVEAQEDYLGFRVFEGQPASAEMTLSSNRDLL